MSIVINAILAEWKRGEEKSGVMGEWRPLVDLTDARVGTSSAMRPQDKRRC